MKKFLLGVCVALLSVASSFAEKPMVTCPYCSGTGQFYVGFMSTPCISCKGTGKIVDPYYQGQQIVKEMQSKSNNSGGYNIVPMEGGTMQNGNSGSSLSYYQNAYSRWERVAKSAYDSLTTLGYSVKRNDRDIEGGAMGTWGASNFSSMKRNMRAAQREMRNVRNEARRHGYNIPMSNYENIDVNF